MKKITTLLACAGALTLVSCNCSQGDFRTINFTEDTLSVLKNPCNGWGVYDDANGPVQNADEYWKEQDEAARKYASFFYVRWRWSDMEPEEGKYAWLYDENYKKLIKGALDRGLKLCFRVYTDSQDNLYQSTPEYVRKAGADGYMAKDFYGKPVWTPYPDDGIFLDKLEKFVKAFAAEYDNPAIVDFVDAYNIGFWGECHSINLKRKGQEQLEKVFDRISGIYSENFKNVMLVLPFGSQVGFEAEKRIAIDGKGYSMRRDGLGSMWFSNREQEITQEMYGKTLMIGESCWWQSSSDSIRPFASDKKYKLNTWRDVYELTCKQAIEHHFNTLDLREIPETTGWTTRAKDLVEKFAVNGGYRIHPISVTCPVEMTVEDSVFIKHKWINTGNGYLPNNVKNWRFKYKPAFALIDSNGKPVKVFVDNDAEPSLWLNNNATDYVFNIRMGGVKAGKYKWAVAIVDTEHGNRPGIKLAVDKPELTDDGWIILCATKIK